MPAAFDLYYKYLGIPPSEQPPNHYRPLGVSLFEGDHSVIESAAARQLACLNRHQSGIHGSAVLKAMAEIVTAKEFLCSGLRKGEYDAGLRRSIGAEPPPPAPPIIVPPPVAPLSAESRRIERQARSRNAAWRTEIGIVQDHFVPHKHPLEHQADWAIDAPAARERFVLVALNCSRVTMYDARRDEKENRATICSLSHLREQNKGQIHRRFGRPL